MAAPEPIVVVSGVPRSGTSLLMQMLERGGMPVLVDGVRSPDADNPHGYYELEAVKRTRQDAGWLAEAPGRAVKVIHALVPSLPADRAYRVIVVRRRFDEVLASQRAMLARRGEPDAGLDDARLAEIFRAQLDELAAWVDSAPDAQRLEVAHAEILRAPRTVSVRVADFLARPLDPDSMAAVVDAALHRQRSEGARGA